MATLAALLKHKGLDVRGSDQDVYPPMSDFLAAEGIQAFSGYRRRADHLRPRFRRDRERHLARQPGARRSARSERSATCRCPRLSANTFLWGARSVVIAGTHGKTTTTALTGWVLTAAGADPSVLLGGIARNFGDQGSSYRLGGGREFVIEGDEYDSAFFDKTAKFLKYLPDIAVVNNIEFDHADIYADIDAVRLAFKRLVNLVPRRGLLLLGADSADALALKDAAVSRVQTFGTAAGCDWQAHDLTPAAATTRFHVTHGGTPLGAFEIPLLGAHNVRNALAAIAVAAKSASTRHVSPRRCRSLPASSVASRSWARRAGSRFTTISRIIQPPSPRRWPACARRAHESRIWAVFEPRSASSCRRVFQDDFARAFAGADLVLLAPVFRSTLPEAQRLSIAQLVDDLSRQGVSARQGGSIDEMIATIVRRAPRRRPGGGDVQRRIWRHSSKAAEGTRLTPPSPIPPTRRPPTSASSWPATPPCWSNSKSGSIGASTKESLRWRAPSARHGSLACAMWCRPIARWACRSTRWGPISGGC